MSSGECLCGRGDVVISPWSSDTSVAGDGSLLGTTIGVVLRGVVWGRIVGGALVIPGPIK